MRSIPILFATDNNYKCLLITMTSILIHAKEESFFQFYIFVDHSFLPESERDIREYLSKEKKNFSLDFINVGNVFDNAPMQIERITRPTFFRLLAPQLLRENKCIYLDTDIIVRTDIGELFDIPIEDYYLAGVKAPAYLHKDEAYCRQALLPDIAHYINAGVLLMNLEKMRQDQIVEHFLALIPLNMESQDQDIINSVCYHKIYFLPFKYNVMNKYALWLLDKYEGIVSKEELLSAWNDPKIIHYADSIKPWNSLNCILGEHWWDICKKSSLWEYYYLALEDEFFGKAVYQGNNQYLTTKRIPALFDLTYPRKYVIYGAGVRAKYVLMYLKENNLAPEFIMVTNSENNPDEIEGISVHALHEVGKELHDKTILIAIRDLFHPEMISNLLKYNYKEIIPVSDQWEKDYREEKEIK